MKGAAAVAAGLLTVVVAAGCSSPPGSSTPTSGPRTATRAAATATTSTPPPTQSTTSSSAPGSSPGSTVATTSTSPSSTSDPVITPAAGTARALTLADVFDPGKWAMETEAPVGGPAQQAIVRKIACAPDFSDADVLEMRFTGAAGTLLITFQQSIISKTSIGVAEASVWVNGKQQLQRFAFEDKRTFTIALAGVHAVRVAVRELPTGTKSCPGSLSAMITQLALS